MAAIDIGPGATDRDSNYAAGYTFIELTNPANDTGTITTYEVWAVNEISGMKVGNFSRVDGDFTPQDYETIGTVTGGSKQVFSGLDCDVETDDYIGEYWTSGYIETSASGEAGLYYKEGDQFDAGEQTYSLWVSRASSVYGIGATVAPPAGRSFGFIIG